MNLRRLLFLFILLIGGRAFAQSVQDSIRIYFHDGKSGLDISLLENKKSMDYLTSYLESLASDTTRQISFIRIEGNASPTGTDAINLRLSRERAEVLMEYVRRYQSVPDSLVKVVCNGVDWKGLEMLVVQDTVLEHRDEILCILRKPSSLVKDPAGRQVDERKLQLMQLSKGKVYRELNQRYFNRMRNSVLLVEVKPLKPALQLPAWIAPVMPITLSERPIPVMEGTLRPMQQPPLKDSPLHRLAVKTNLIYDAVLMPSLEVEYRINDRWSFNLEGDMAWWKKDSRHKYYQLATISPEGRYWFKTRKPWHGHYVGLFSGFTWYDLENGEQGYKGEAVTAGLSYGYMFPIGRNLSLEAGLGVGFMHTEYEEYLPIDGCYVYQQTKQMNYFGPLKLKFALVWRLWDAKKKGGRL